MKKYFSVILSSFAFVPAISFASTADCARTGEVNNLFGNLSFFPHYCTATDLILHVISLIFAFIGIVSILMVVIGGFEYVGAGVNPDLVKKAKATIQYAVIGLIVAALSYSIVTIVINFVGSGGNSGVTTVGGGTGSGNPGDGGATGSGGTNGGSSSSTIKNVTLSIVPSSVSEGDPFNVAPSIDGGISGNGTIDVYAISSDGTKSKPLCDPNLADGQICSIGTGPQDSDGFFTSGAYKIVVAYYDANGNKIGESSGNDTITITSTSGSGSTTSNSIPVN